MKLPNPTPRRGSTAPHWFLAAASLAGLAAAGPSAGQQVAPSAQLTPEEMANIRVYEAANRSVVNITTSTVSYDPVFRLPIAGEGSGSGAVVDRLGHVLTNQHVVDGAEQIQVTFANGRSYDAKLVGADKEYDMAVLRVDAPVEELFPIRLGRSDNLRVGQRVYVLGNPFGLDGSLTTGIVSSLNRSLPSRVTDRVVDGMIQTDAAMNPGNSGGPMLNTQAEMVGMCVAIRSAVGQNSGVGFAIPVDRVRRFLPELVERGKVLRAYHGIVLVNPTARGLRIAQLAPGGPAAQAGLRGFREVVRTQRRGPIVYREVAVDREAADYILAIDGKPISTHEEFLSAMDQRRPGDTVAFTIRREGSEMVVNVTLGEA